MTVLKPFQMKEVLPLFPRKDTYAIARSACLGLVPCKVFADSAKAPTAAVVVLRRIGIAFVGGDARFAGKLLKALGDLHPWYAVYDPPEAWQPALSAYSKESFAAVRYAFTNNPSVLDMARLGALGWPPPGMALRRYDEALLTQALANPWSEDQMGVFETPEAFFKNGFGIALVQNGLLVAGCSSFCRHMGGYELQVDTHPEHRGHGYAACVSAAFMLEALSRGMTPHWDAANSRSLRLAEKLGYALQRAYPVWLLVSPKTTAQAVSAQFLGI